MNSYGNVLLALATDKEGDTTEIEKTDEVIAKKIQLINTRMSRLISWVRLFMYVDSCKLMR